MSSLRTILLSVVIVSSFLIQTEGADKYTDENRPYEFGFNIEGEQHRHEKKDEKGLIMGEFGFITADGVYHVTVYATDEQGRFKILSMKNIRVKPYPTYKRPEAGSERQGHSLELPRTTIPKSQVREPEPPKKISIEPPARSCSSCSLPTTQAPAPAFVQPSYNQNALVNPQTGLSNQNGPGQSSPSFDPARSISTQMSQLGGAGISRTANAQTGFNSQNGPGQSSPSFDPARSISTQTSQLGGAGIPRTANAQTGFNSQNGPGQSSPSFDPSRSISTQTSQLGGAGIPRTANAQTGFNSQNGPGQSSPSFDPARSISTQTSQLGGAGIPRTANAQTGFNSQNGPGQSSPSFDPSSSKNTQTASLGEAGIPRTAANAQTGFNNQNLPDQGLAYPQQNSPSFNPSEPTNQLAGAGIARTAKKYDGQSQYNQEQGLPKKPTLISAQMQIVDKNTDIYRRGPGEKEGLPKGLAKEDMTQLLYTFNYTVGFHGHFEEGYRNGAKQGYYFITGRNGVRSRVDYVADEKGFRPTITQEVLDVLSDDVPKPETEKDEKYGLKGYEFKWLYFPV